jgi:molybdopterin molybdotransferase
MQRATTLREISCADDYDPNSMPVDRARELIRRFLHPVRAVERVNVRQALGRTLAGDIVSPIDVPGHDNSAMDGWAVRFADLARDGETKLARVGDSFAGRKMRCPAALHLTFAIPVCMADGVSTHLNAPTE